MSNHLPTRSGYVAHRHLFLAYEVGQPADIRGKAASAMLPTRTVVVERTFFRYCLALGFFEVFLARTLL